MPRKASRSKNARRVVAADNALNAVVKRSRPRPPRQRVPRALSSADRYIQSLRDDVLEPMYDLPTHSYTGPYTKRRITGRYTLNNANLASLNAGFVLNPWLAWCDNFYVQHLVAGVDATSTIPTIYQHATTSLSPGFPANSGGGVLAMTAANQISNTAAKAYGGKVRCNGVHMRLTYTGTALNQGGTIFCFHNPSNSALACQFETGTAAQWPATKYDEANEIDQALTNCRSFRAQEGFSWTWRPNDSEFRDIQSFFPYESPAVAGAACGNPSCFDYLPPESAGATCAPKGWVVGCAIRSAAGTQAALSNWVLDLEIDYDLHVFQQGADSGAGQAILAPTHRAIADPSGAARIQNALGALHHERSIGVMPPSAKSMSVKALAGFESAAKATVKSAVIDGIASRLASMV